MLDYHLAATDGEPGRVHDFLFDDESWIVHYLVAETAEPAAKRLILPFVAGQPDWEAKRIPVFLTCEQIRNCPLFESDMLTSRQRKLDLKRQVSHLRSTRDLLGYSIHTTDGEVGSIEDFIIEDSLWGVQHTVVTLNKPPLRSILLPPDSIRSISWSSKAAWANLSLRELERIPDFDPATPVDEDDERRRYDYYGHPVNPPPPFALENRREAQY